MGCVVGVIRKKLLSEGKKGNKHGLGTRHTPEVVAARARKVSGGLNTSAKVTDAVATEIRAKFDSGSRQVDLMAEYELDRVTVHRIVRRKTYRSGISGE